MNCLFPITRPGPEVIKLFVPDSVEHEIFLLVNLKLLTTAYSVLLNIHVVEHENFFANKYENTNYFWHFHIY